MSRTRWIAAIAAGAVLIGAAACRGTSAAQTNWSYEGDTGPAHWGELSPAFAPAKEGRSQSPIDIVRARVTAGGGPIRLGGTNAIDEVVNDGRSIRVKVSGDGTLETPTGTYASRRLEFHSPSEHTIDGEHAAMELQLVHANDAGDFAVVGLLIEKGEENAFFAELWPSILAGEGASDAIDGVEFEASSLLPESRRTWRYSGSLTTPPCTEGVDWTVFQSPIHASADQIAAFRKVMHGNARPTQPWNGRRVRNGF